MSRYIVRVVERDGVACYLKRGRLTHWSDNATHYPHPSNAEQALAAFKNKYPKLVAHTSVIDTRDEP